MEWTAADGSRAAGDEGAGAGVPRTVIDETIHIEGAVPEPWLMKEFAKVLDK